MLFVSRDRGERWTELASLREIPSAPTWSFPPRPWTSHVRWIAPSPHDAALLLVGIELGGVMRSEDGGETWSDHRPGAQLGLPLARLAPDRSRPGLRGGRRRRSLEPRRRRDVEARRRRPRPPLHLGGRRRSRGSRPLVRLGEHRAVRGARHARSAEAVVYRWRGSEPWEGAGGRPAAAARRDAVRARVRRRRARRRARRRDGLCDRRRRRVLGAGNRSRATRRRGSWPSPSERRPAPRGARPARAAAAPWRRRRRSSSTPARACSSARGGP